MTRTGRLVRAVPAAGEDFHLVAQLGDVRIEHIVSSATPDPATQAQDRDEWVLLLAGSATLAVAEHRLELGPGDWVLLPARTPHAVLRTAPGTRWLAVHAAPPPAG